MNQKIAQTLEFDKVLKMLEEYAVSEQAAERLGRLEPYLSEAEVNRHLSETTEARRIMECSGNPPLSAMKDMEKMLSVPGKGTFLTPEELSSIAQFLTASRRMKSYLKKSETTGAAVAFYGASLHELSEVEEEINRAIRANQVDDRASPKLADIRRKIENSGNQIKSKLDSLLRNNSQWFSEGFVSIRNGHFTLPVKREYKSRVIGSVIDISQSGGTYFIEPAAARKLQEELSLLYIEEENEVRRILYTLTAIVEEYLPMIRVNVEAMETLDFIFAKAKLSIAMKAVPLPVTLERRIEIKAGRHPLLKAESLVPLDFSLGGGVRGIVITGPNTGGKTVALKTVGLLSLMAQSGLHVPAGDGCFTMNNYTLCDIGDGQSITENLSTFSSHMTNIIGILRLADDQSFVLLDELGSGTDPAEGMGLATAILEELASKNCLFVATTHYPEIKEFAKTASGLTNARMAFDRKSLLPLYRLEIGEAGESCALYIAKRLGLPQRLIDRAGEAAYGQDAREQSRAAGPGVGALPAGGRAQGRHDGGSAAEGRPEAGAWPGQDAGAEAGPDGQRHRIKAQEPAKPLPAQSPRSEKFNIGDSVMVFPQKMIGIVYQKTNEKGEIGVQLRKNKLLVNHKRLKLHVPADQLYPDNYDFSIIFDSVAARKAHRIMDHRHEPGLEVLINTGKKQ